MIIELAPKFHNIARLHIDKSIMSRRHSRFLRLLVLMLLFGVIQAVTPPPCGDGKLEALDDTHGDRCPLVGSQSAQQTATVTKKETCDVNSAALFGSFNDGCGANAAIGGNTCQLVTDATSGVDITDKTDAVERSAQRVWGVTTLEQDALDAVNPCLYATQMESATGATTAFADATKCTVMYEDLVKYTSLANCFNANPSDADFGKQLTAASGSFSVATASGGTETIDQGNNFQLYGHKCNSVLDIAVKGAVGGSQSWEATNDANDDFTVYPTALTGGTTGTPAVYESMHKMCFSINDPSWPSLSPSSNEFLSQRTRIQYQIVCDPYDQDESYADTGCEDSGATPGDPGAYGTDPASDSHKCTRLGNRVNPCSRQDRLWSLYTCDENSCESLETLSAEYTNAYKTDPTDKKGTVYTFEHDSMADKNKFQCTTKDFDNIKLASAGFIQGDATQAQSQHICATGGQDEACEAGLGEIVHHIDTCSNGIGLEDIDALNSHSSWVANPVTGSDQEDVQTYPIGCNRHLRIRIKKAVAGQMMLRVVAKSFNTAVEEGDASKGYTYWSSKLVPVSIEAVVKPLTATHVQASPASEVNEGSAVNFLGSPFNGISVAEYSDVSETSRVDKFSRSTRGHLEFVECTADGAVLSIEGDATVERFSLTAQGSEAWSGVYSFFSNSAVDAALRTYELTAPNAYTAPAIHELQTFNPELKLRSALNALGGHTDAYHEGYSNNNGLCLKTRLHLYEPSSCSQSVYTSDEYYIRAHPVNALKPTISLDQAVYVYDEDASVPLRVNIGHQSPAEGDSEAWYFSHVDVEDMYSASADESKGTDFDMFSYGNTAGASSGTSDAISSSPGITKIAGNKWRSYANGCTRWIAENPGAGGFNDPALDTTGFADAEACLNDARRESEEIWGSSGGKSGIWLRPKRKSTKNLHLKVTVYIVDGSKGWHAANPNGAGAIVTEESAEIHLLHVPRSTRYNQEEVLMQNFVAAENGEIDVVFNPSQVSGVEIPLPYRSGTHVCTYTTNSGTGVDEVDTTHANHDIACDPANQQSGSGVVFGTCAESTSHNVQCKLSDAEATPNGPRGKLKQVVIFDESDDMLLPEAAPYQPAGYNLHAHEDYQWYAIEPSSSNGATVQSVCWCTDSASVSYSTASGYTGSTAICDAITVTGQSEDGITAASNSPVSNEAAVLNGRATAQSVNYWVVERQGVSEGTALPLNSLKLNAKSDFNTRDASQSPSDVQVTLRLIATLEDSVTASAAFMDQIGLSGTTPYTWKAVSTSDPAQGAFTVEVTSVRQKVLPSKDDHAWNAGAADTDISFVEEMNDHSRVQMAPARLWSDVAATTSVTLTTGLTAVDCDASEPSNTFCADRLRVTEANNFHDQHVGRVSIMACVRKIGGSTCHPAGGLFGVKLDIGGSVIDIDDAASPIDIAPTGTTSQCAIKLEEEILSDPAMTANDVDAMRGTRCVMVPKVDDIGTGGIWSNYKLWEVLTNDGLTTPLNAKALKSRLRFVFPEKWSNDIEFEFTMIVGNDDRDDPSMDTQHNSDPLVWKVRPQRVAEEPVMWLGTDLSVAFNSLGSGAGVQAMGMDNRLATCTSCYVPPGPTLNLDANRAMSEIDVVAGYQHQIMIKAGTGAYDQQGVTLVPPLTTSTDGYKWDSLRSILGASGERVFLTIESAYDDMVAGESPQNFCVFLCPPGQAGCHKSDLQRLVSLDSGDDFTSSDVNCDGPDCDDNHGRDASLTGCPSYAAGSSNNPGSRYSYRCAETGTCDELQYLYIQYPADQIKDDLLEICAWSRDDYRAGVTPGQLTGGYQRSCITMNVKVAPSITLSSVGFNNMPISLAEITADSDMTCDDDQSPQVACPTGWYGAPLQASQEVTIANDVMAVSLSESDLYGGADPNLCAMDVSNADGSSSTQGVNCGLRFPISFPSEKDAQGYDLTLASPVGISLAISVDLTDPTSRITATELAQALRLVCTNQAMTATNAASGQCQAIMSASATSSELQFYVLGADGTPETDASTGLPVVSQYPANRLTWTVGEVMKQKEILLRGGDTSLPWSYSHYSFENHKCEQSRKFRVSVEHQPGYTPAIVDSRRSLMEVVVRDDDFFGKISVGKYDSGSSAVVALAADETIAASKSDWESNGFDVYVIRSRTAFEMEAVNAGIALHEMDVEMKMAVTTFEDDEFEVKVCDVDATSFSISNCVDQSLADIRSRGMHVSIAFGATTVSDSLGPVQYKVVRFVQQAGASASCITGQSASVQFELANAKYKNTGSELDGSLISGCGNRDPVDISASATKSYGAQYSVSVNAQDDSPFQMGFAGFRPSASTGFEGSKASPLAWNAGLDGSYVSITETEHSDCQASGTGFVCAPRAFRVHLCRELRDATWSAWGGGQPVTTEFFVQIDDNDAQYAQIGEFYRLECPDTTVLQAIKDQYGQNGLNTLTCEQMAVGTDGSGNAQSCADHPSLCLKQTRLLWTFQTGATMGRDLFLCPTTGADSEFTNLPYAIFVNRDDNGLINLSRRPTLQISNDKKPSGDSTCAYSGPQSALVLRVEDDEMFAVDNTQLDAETSENRAVFEPPQWDSSEGRMKVDVTLPYFLQGEEKTLVNIGVGSCAKERWEAPFNAGANNPLSSFGTCDMLLNGLNGKIAASMANEDAFAAVFGSDSYQTSQADYDAGNLFGTAAADNYLFTTLNSNPGGAAHTQAWSAQATTIDNHHNDDLTSKGFKATFSASIQQLQACQDFQGNGVTSVSVDTTTGDTVYSFKMSQTQVTAMRQGDTSYAHWAASCTETDYELRVSNSIFALSGVDSNAQRNAIYVVSAEYSDTGVDGTCSAATCDSGIGPKHACPSQTAIDNAQTLVKALGYVVNLDMRDVVNDVLLTDTNTGLQQRTQVTSYFGVAAVSDVSVDTTGSNCYGVGATVVDPKVTGAGAYTEAGVTRTEIQFKSKCANLQNANGDYASDVFASCSDDNARATNFNFEVRLYECTSQAHLADPSNHGDCQKLPDPLRVNVALAHTENPVAIQYTVQFDKLQRFYRSFDHRDNGAFRGVAQIGGWRESNTFATSATDPYVKYSPQSVLVSSIGFVEGSALEATMTTSLKKVRLCRFREFCSLASIAPESGCGGAGQRACAPVCTQANTMIDKTHSPFVRWASNTKLDSNSARGCADPGAPSSCRPVTRQTSNPLPEFTCDRSKWEDFLVSEMQAILDDGDSASLVSGDLGVSVLTLGSLVTGFDPVVEAQLMVDHGATTQRAEDVYGNCEKNPENAGVETVEGGVQLTHLFPQAPADGSVGTCTCKGVKAYNFDDGSNTFPYRAASARKVVYDAAEGYNPSVADPANLHVCTWRNTPHHSVSSEPLQSNDQFVMSLNKLRVGEAYFVEMEATQYDHTGFASVDPSYDQFDGATSRRLLATTDEVHPIIMPQGQVDLEETQNSRKLLALGSVTDQLSQTLLFPQGVARMTESVQPAYTTAASGGIIVDGPIVEDVMDVDEVEEEFIQTSSDAIFDLMELGSLRGPEQLVNTMRIVLDSDAMSGDFSDMFNSTKVKASIAVSPAVALIQGSITALVAAASSPMVAMGISGSAAFSAAKVAGFSGAAMFPRVGAKGGFTDYRYYSRFFFESINHRGTADLAFCGGRFAQNAFVVLFNEFALIFTGYYLIALVLTGFAIAVVLPIALIEHAALAKRPSKETRYVRQTAMTLVWFILDYSVLEMLWVLVVGACRYSPKYEGKDELDSNIAHSVKAYHHIKKKGHVKRSWFTIPFMLCLRIVIALYTALFIPLSVAAALICYAYMMVSRLGCWVKFETMRECIRVESDTKKKTAFFGTETDSLENQTPWTLFPWEWYGVGKGQREFDSDTTKFTGPSVNPTQACASASAFHMGKFPSTQTTLDEEDPAASNENQSLVKKPSNAFKF